MAVNKRPLELCSLCSAKNLMRIGAIQYVIEAPLRVFIFDNRIEIHSPGLLPEGVSTESIKHGASVPRNKLLFNHGINLLPYTGAGSGITRVLNFTPDIKFVNDDVRICE
jgi:predicted HTH transcriptional regulator